MPAIAALLIAAAGPRPWVIDGDTLRFNRERVRVLNLDAPDIGRHAKCAVERQRGEAAKAYAIAIVRDARKVAVKDRDGLDRYGRTLARVSVDGRDFGTLMIAAGHGRPWRGRSSDWCAPRAARNF